MVMRVIKLLSESLRLAVVSTAIDSGSIAKASCRSNPESDATIFVSYL